MQDTAMQNICTEVISFNYLLLYNVCCCFSVHTVNVQRCELVFFTGYSAIYNVIRVFIIMHILQIFFVVYMLDQNDIMGYE